MAKNNKSEAAILRQKAEELLKKKPSKSRLQLSEGEMQKLIHEFEVHQIELEMQNEELVLAKEQVELAAIEKATDEVSEFAENIINTVREPLLVLDQDLRVVKASRSFYNFFKVTAGETIGKLIYDLGDNQWDIPKLRDLLETILPQKTTFDDYEVEHNFSTIGKRVMLLNARQIKRAFGKEKIILLVIEDITERKLVEESLSEESRMTSEYLDILLDHTHAPIIIWDSSLVIKRFNRQFEKLSGYNSTEVIDRKIDILFPKDKIDSTLELLNKHLSDEDSEVIEVDILTKDNDIKTVIWNSANILDKEGTNTVATIAQDITRRKRTEEVLGILETRYRRLFESAKDGILILDAETGKIIDVNPFLMELLGYSKEEMMGKEMWKVGFFKDIADNKEKFAELQQREYVRNDMPLETASGRKINVEFVSNVYLVNKNQVIQCNIRDITERKRTEDALLESEIKYRAFFENSMDAILLTSPDGKILSVNQAACDMFGYSEDELIRLGKSGIVDRSDSRLPVLLDERKLKGKARGEVTFLRKDRTEIPVEISSAIFKNQEGSERTSMIIRDITERKRTEEALRESERLYRSLFENMLNGFAYCKMIFEDERPQDFIYLAVNKSFEKLTGLKDVIGKKVSHVLPGIRKSDPLLLELYGRVVSTGKPETIEIYVEALKMWFSVSVYSPMNEHFVSLFEVIDKRKNAEEVLRQSEAKFRNLINSLPDSVLVIDSQGRIVFCNEIAMKTFDYNFDEMLRCTMEDLIPKPYRKLHKTLRNEFISQPKSRAMGVGKELFAQRKGGSEFPTEIMLEPVEINGNQFTVAIVRDITERKKIQNELKFQANLLNNVGQAVIATDLHGNIVYWNKAAERIYGWSTSEAIGQNIMDLTPAQQTNEQAIEIMKELSAGKTWSGEFHVKRKDGSSFPVLVTDTPILNTNGKLTGIIGISSDITERNQIQQKIKDSEEKFRIITENSADAIFITDKEGKYIYVNKQAVDLLGYSKEELLTFTIADITPKNRIEEYFQIFQQLFITGISYSEIELVKKDGSYSDIDINAVLLPNGWIFGSCRDISKRKQLENELIIAKEKAEESDRLKSAFLANMSHEVRTPLNSIIGFSELLGDPDFEEDQKNEFIQHIIASGNNLLTIISDIMDISKMESGEITIRKKPINTHEYVLGIYEQFSFQAETHKLELILNLPDNDKETEIFADAERLMQIFNNLIGNAFKFTSEGKIEIGFQPKGKMVEFFVKDTGIGIPASYHDKIFDRFRQVEDAKNRKYGGNGLGLAITKNLVGLMGGKIRLESNEGIGSTFYFTLPCY